MLASDGEIKELLACGALAVSPLSPEQIQPASIDVRLDDSFKWPSALSGVLDPWEPVDELFAERTVPPGESFILRPFDFALAATVEHVTVGPAHALTLEGCSSLGRLGLIVHATAGYIDPCFRGTITLELFNCTRLPIRLWPGMKIGQLAVHPLGRAAERGYGSAGLGSHYQDQPRGPQVSQAWRNFRAVPPRHLDQPVG